MKTVTLNNYKTDQYYNKIVDAFKSILANGEIITPIQIFQSLKLLDEADIYDWKNGKYQYLEEVIKCNLNKASRILKIISFYAHDLDMKRTIYRYNGNSKIHILRFSKTKNSNIEKAYSTHFIWMRRNKEL